MALQCPGISSLFWHSYSVEQGFPEFRGAVGVIRKENPG